MFRLLRTFPLKDGIGQVLESDGVSGRTRTNNLAGATALNRRYARINNFSSSGTGACMCLAGPIEDRYRERTMGRHIAALPP
jgi:hypothetical protein